MGGYGAGYLSIARMRKLRKLKKAGAFIISAAACIVFLLYVSQRVRTVEAGYEVEKFKAERSELARVNELLRVEVATLSSPSRIEEVAAARLGMRVPDESQVVVVRELRQGETPERPGNARLVRNDAGRRAAAGG